MNWLRRIPTAFLVILALVMCVAPLTPEPHLVEKTRLLVNGELSSPLDVIDLLLHIAPLVLLFIKTILLKPAHEPDRHD